jgi:hypothetical protein
MEISTVSIKTGRFIWKLPRFAKLMVIIIFRLHPLLLFKIMRMETNITPSKKSNKTLKSIFQSYLIGLLVLMLQTRRLKLNVRFKEGQEGLEHTM